MPLSLPRARHSLIFDAWLFDTSKSSVHDRTAQFTQIQLKSGSYVSFVHLVGPTSVRSIPICILVNAKHLQPKFPVIYLEVVTVPGGSSEADVTVVNPTPMQVDVRSLTLGQNAPPQMHVRLEGSAPIACARQAHTTIGKIVLKGVTAGEIETSVVIAYECQTAQTLEIPVKAFVEFGSLEPSATGLDLMRGSHNVAGVTFTNRFRVPVAVVAARVDSPVFHVVQFVPFVLEPGETSPEIRVKYTYQSGVTDLEAILAVDTNATNHRIPVRGYNNELTVSDRPDLVFDAHKPLVLTANRVLCGSMRKYVLYLRNPNPNPCTINNTETTPGIFLNTSFVPFTIPAFATERWEICIVFNGVQSARPRNDSLRLSGSSPNVTVSFSWTPFRGSVRATCSLPRTVLVGHSYNATLFLNSSYTAPFAVRNVTSSHGFVYLTPHSSVTVRPKTPISVATFRFDAVPDELGLSLFGYDNWTDIPGQIAAWKAPPSASRFDLGLEIHSRGNSILPLRVTARLAFPTIQNTSFDVGYVLMDSVLMQPVQIENPLLCAVVFHSQYFHTVARPHEMAVMQVQFAVAELGTFELSFPVTTNITAPFWVHLRGIAAPPQVRFLDDNGNTLKSVVLQSESLRTVIFLKNTGRTGVSLSELQVSPPKFKLKTNCSRFLERRHLCFIAIEAVRGMIETVSETATLTVEAHTAEFAIGVSAQLGEDSLKKLKMKRWILRWMARVFLFSPIIEFMVWFLRLIFGCYRVRKRNGGRPRVVRELTVPSMIDVELQVTLGKVNGQSSGIWVSTQHVRAPVTKESLAEMEALIASAV
jgi:hypothetical protein